MDTTNVDQSPHPNYLKGFNEGYTMAKYMPDVAKEISEAMKDTERGNGFKEGNAQYILDKEQERELKNEKADTIRMPDWLQPEQDQPDLSGNEKERDEPEPELE